MQRMGEITFLTINMWMFISSSVYSVNCSTHKHLPHSTHSEIWAQLNNFNLLIRLKIWTTLKSSEVYHSYKSNPALSTLLLFLLLMSSFSPSLFPPVLSCLPHPHPSLPVMYSSSSSILLDPHVSSHSCPVSSVTPSSQSSFLLHSPVF